MMAGNANTIMNAVTSMAQANTGMRPRVMPGARVIKMPTINSIAPAIAEISMNPMPSSQKSAPSPGEYSLPLSGGYMNQPLSGDTPQKMVQKKASPPIA